MVWSEEFDGGPEPDRATWTHDLGDRGWGNRELQRYTDELTNVRVEDGHLIITARKTEGGGFTSGRIKTEGKVTFRYGTVEARIKTPDLADGLWPAFWTLGQNFSEVGWPGCGEIDVLEMGFKGSLTDGVVNRRVNSALHWRAGKRHAHTPSSLNLEESLADTFHVYRLEWTPTSIITKIDGETILKFDLPPESESADWAAFHRPHFLLLNLAVGGNYPGILEAEGITAPLPGELVVDWVRLYDNGFTELGGSAIEAGADGAEPADDGEADDTP